MNRVKELREQKGLSQEQLADRVGAHYTTISKIERGVQQLNVRWMERIAEALGVTVREFVEQPEDIASRLSALEAKLDKATAKIDRLMAHLGIKED